MNHAFTWVFLAALAAATGTRLWLATRQARHVRAHRDAVPAPFAAAIPLAAHQKAADYTVAKVRLGVLDVLVNAALLLALTLGGAVQWMSEAWAMKSAATASYSAVPFMLTVAPRETTKRQAWRETPLRSTPWMVSGNVAELLAVEKAVARAGSMLRT